MKITKNIIDWIWDTYQAYWEIGRALWIFVLWVGMGIVWWNITTIEYKTEKQVFSNFNTTTTRIYALQDGLRKWVAMLELAQRTTTQSQEDQRTILSLNQQWQSQIQPAWDSLQKYWYENPPSGFGELRLDMTKLSNIQKQFVPRFPTMNKTVYQNKDTKGNITEIFFNPELENRLNVQILPIYKNIAQILTAFNDDNQIATTNFYFRTQTKQNTYFWTGIITWAVVAVSLLMIFLYDITQKRKSVKSIAHFLQEVLQGELPAKIQNLPEYYGEIGRDLHQIVRELTKVPQLASQIKNQDFKKEINFMGKLGEVGEAFSQIQKNIKNIITQNKQDEWVNAGLAKFGDYLTRSADNLEDFADQILMQFINYTKANQGGFFILKQNQLDAKLHLIASYAYQKKKYMTKEIPIGNGLIGQAWQEGEMMYLREIPQGYTLISSGLGDATPKVLLIIPLKNQGKVFGMIEIASFVDYQPHELDFVRKVADAIGQTLGNTFMREIKNY
jgi:putative methionine-R-sulfoxide reductase with GAF domain